MSYPEYHSFNAKIEELEKEWARFIVEFLDRVTFKQYTDRLHDHLSRFKNICITGYFGETVNKTLQTLSKSRRVRILSPKLRPNYERDLMSLQVLEDISKEGGVIKLNNRLHARFMVAWNEEPKKDRELRPKIHGVLVIGSFDFNKEGMGEERYDAGIKTGHPDLVRHAIDLFEDVWNDRHSISIQYKMLSDKNLQDHIDKVEAELRKEKQGFHDLKKTLSENEIRLEQDAIVTKEAILRELYEEKKRRK